MFSVAKHLRTDCMIQIKKHTHTNQPMKLFCVKRMRPVNQVAPLDELKLTLTLELSICMFTLIDQGNFFLV